MLYGTPNESSGSIISGIVSLAIKPRDSSKNAELLTTSSSSETSLVGLGQELQLETVTLSLIQTLRYSRPFSIPSSSVSACKDCQIRTTVLARWDILTSPAMFPVGKHAYPFSHFLPGSLPPTSKLGSSQSNMYILYKLVAVGKVPNSTKETVTTLPIFVSRLILRGPDRNSLRVFPPTEVSASAVLPNVVYPKSTFPIELKLDNIVSTKQDRRWRMRKLVWRIEESVNVRAYCCDKHKHKIKTLEEAERRNHIFPTRPDKNSHLHHTTVQTNMTLSRNPTDYFVNPTNQEQDEVVEEQANLSAEYEESILNGPAQVHESFIEDFLTPSAATHLAEERENSARNSGHSTPPPGIDDEEHLFLEEIRTVAHGEFKSGWKSDFTGRGKIELVAEINAFDFSTGFHSHISKSCSDTDDKSESTIRALRNGANVACEVDDPTLGIFVNHTLNVEVVVAEEIIHSVERKLKESMLKPVDSTSSVGSDSSTPRPPSSPSPTPQMGVPTGAARVLRMQFKIILTERSGLGIAWDDEVPPTYEDVRTLSPPTYQEKSSVTSNAPTPVLNFSSPILQEQRNDVIYGLGSTPLVGSFGNNHTLNIDSMIDLNDRINDFTL
jgi:hypothetical protein